VNGLLASGPVAVEADDVSVLLGGLPVLRGIDLAVRPGEAVALLGGNGSGKSTLVRALLGLVPLRRGTVRLFGTPVADFRGWSRVGYVPQRSVATLGGSRVREVVASGRLSRRRLFQPSSRADRAAVRAALDRVGLAARARDDVGELSGGQQQRVLIARALAGQPDLLVLDEPNAGVDVEHQRVLAQLLGQLVAEGCAVVVVLHEIGPLEPLLDRAVVLSQGRVVEQGGPDVLIAGHRRLGEHHDHHDGRTHEPVQHRVDSGLSGAVEP
jgi:zinc transport system ATP-binding protein